MAAKTGAQIEISAGTSRLAAGLNAARQAFTKWGGTVARGIGTAFKGVNKLLEPGDTMKRAVGNLGGDLMGRGLDAIISGANDVRDFERNLVRFKIAAGDAGPTAGEFRKQISDVSKATGIARSEILAGASAYVGFTGDAEGATAAAELFARVAAATGSSTTDVAQAMSSLSSSMGIAASEGEAAFSALIVQGKGGAVEVKDMASQLAGLAPTFALFKGGKGVQGLRELGAGFQVIMKNAATASDAGTKYSALMSSLGDPKTLKALKGFGVQVTDNKGRLLDASTVFENIAKSKKLFEKTNLSRAFGRQEARLAVLALREHIGTYRELRDAAQDTGAVQRDMNEFLESDAGRLDKAFNDMKVAIADAFTPERISGFTNAIAQLAEKIGPLVETVGWMADKLGGLTNVGKNIRRSIGGGEMRSRYERSVDEYMAGEGEMMGRKALPGEFTEMQVAGAKSRLADDKARQMAIQGILAGEVNDRTTKDSIRRAILEANNGYGLEYGKGRIGAQTAGEQYLRAAGVTPEERAKIENEMFLEAVKQMPDAVREGIAAAAGFLKPTIQIGDNQVARSANKGTDARRG